MMAGTLIDAIMGVMEQAFDPHWREAWTRAQVAGSLGMPQTHAILIDREGRILERGAAPVAGFVLARRNLYEEELLLIGVRPGCRGRGLGSALIAWQIENARAAGMEKIFLEMREGNPAASLYARAGFSPIGRRPEYYRALDGTRIDAITYGLALERSV